MLTGERKREIMRRLELYGQVQVSILSKEWGISPDSVRRDLRDLAEDGLVQRVHGGALPAARAEADYRGRERISADAKGRIARCAAELVRPGQVVAIDGGTTTLELVSRLPLSLEATVVTHSPTIAAALEHHRGIEVILIGGRLFRHSMVSVGTRTTETISSIQTDIFFLGATGVHPEAGVTTGDWEEAAVKRAFADQAAEVVLLVTPEKVSVASPFRVMAVTDVDTLIFDHDVASAEVERYEGLGLSVIVAAASSLEAAD